MIIEWPLRISFSFHVCRAVIRSPLTFLIILNLDVPGWKVCIGIDMVNLLAHWECIGMYLCAKSILVYVITAIIMIDNINVIALFMTLCWRNSHGTSMNYIFCQTMSLPPIIIRHYFSCKMSFKRREWSTLYWHSPCVILDRADTVNFTPLELYHSVFMSRVWWVGYWFGLFAFVHYNSLTDRSINNTPIEASTYLFSIWSISWLCRPFKLDHRNE